MPNCTIASSMGLSTGSGKANGSALVFILSTIGVSHTGGIFLLSGLAIMGSCGASKSAKIPVNISNAKRNKGTIGHLLMKLQTAPKVLFSAPICLRRFSDNSTCAIF